MDPRMKVTSSWFLKSDPNSDCDPKADPDPNLRPLAMLYRKDQVHFDFLKFFVPSLISLSRDLNLLSTLVVPQW